MNTSPRRHSPMSLEQHRQLGRQVQQFRLYIMRQHIMCVGPKSSKEAKAVWRTYEALGELKNQMDNVVCRDFPACPDAHKIYYGDSWKNVVPAEFEVEMREVRP